MNNFNKDHFEPKVNYTSKHPKQLDFQKTLSNAFHLKMRVNMTQFVVHRGDSFALE